MQRSASLACLACLAACVLCTAHADTVTWHSGKTWEDAVTLEVSNATEPVLHIRYHGRQSWWRGVASVRFGQGDAIGRPGVAYVADGSQAFNVERLEATSDGTELQGRAGDRNIWLPRWQRLVLLDTLPQPAPSGPPTQERIGDVKPEDDEKIAIELAPPYPLPNGLGTLRAPLGWKRIQMGDEGPSFVYRFSPPPDTYPGDKPTLTLRAQPIMVGGAGRRDETLYAEMLASRFQRILLGKGLTPTTATQQLPAELSGRRWTLLRRWAKDAKGKVYVAAFYGYIGQRWMYHFTLVSGEAHHDKLAAILHAVASAYSPQEP